MVLCTTKKDNYVVDSIMDYKGKNYKIEKITHLKRDCVELTLKEVEKCRRITG